MIDRLAAFAQNGLEVLRFGGLDTGERPAPYRVPHRAPMYTLRRYFPDVATGPPVVLVPPMMLAADVYDVSPAVSAVTLLREHGADPWVVDFGAPDRVDGGLTRTLTDHVVAVCEAVEQVRAATGRDVHLAGYSQGGMFCYQAAAYLRGAGVASVVTYGSPVDTRVALPFGLPDELVTRGAAFLAEHLFPSWAVPAWVSRTGFRLLDPVKSVRARVDFLRQLHDRSALLPRERQRRFLDGDGWVAWSGPAVAELLQQFVVHNRMVSGGFVINDRLVTLADLTCPILRFVGEIDEIWQPAAVRGIDRAAPNAAVHEVALRAGHFGLVVGGSARTVTWPTTAAWALWCDGAGELPEHVLPAAAGPPPAAPSPPTTGLGAVTDLGVGAARVLLASADRAVRGVRELAADAAGQLPRLARLERLRPSTRMSLGLLLAERTRRAPADVCFLFDGRPYTNAAFATRVDNVVRGLVHLGVRQGAHVGVLTETRPSGLTAVAALNRLGAVAVLLRPGPDLPRELALGEVGPVVADPAHAVAAVAAVGDVGRVFVLGGGAGPRADGELPDGARDMERIDPAEVRLPAWFTPDPGLAREPAFVVFSGSGEGTAAKRVTNHRWALSAFGTASSAALSASDTVYCVTPLHNPSGLLTSLGGAVAGGARIALAGGFDPDTFWDEVRRHGATVVSYTWTMLRPLVAAPPHPAEAHHPVRLFIGSGMPRGLWLRVLDRFAPAAVLEFYASTEGDAVLANLSGAKAGAKGRPLPGSARVRLAAVDERTGLPRYNRDGFAVEARPDRVGLLLARPRSAAERAGAHVLRGVFEPGDAWLSTGDLFRRDADGDHRMVDSAATVVRTEHGPAYVWPIADALGELAAVDLVVTYGVGGVGGVGGADGHAVTALTLRPGHTLDAAAVVAALAAVPVANRPTVVHVVDDIPTTPWYRPDPGPLRAAGLPTPGAGVWYL